MLKFISQQTVLFIATSDREGNCDNSIRTGAAGFVKVLSPKTIDYPEYRGNGVYASLGNIEENPHVGMLLVDFLGSV
ncbi:MAG: putative pyridoxine 5'-phosphate oxidase superfamily flavin-nucleotide-binding protein [Cryomorphaceae bacterium]|jgi:predicted pyridoxine 5'-phosphate oxidase superfamily flavin-nucleotide-binding protein